MIDEYVLKYITDFLRLCKKCKKYYIYNNEQKCCICNNFFCENCKDDLIDVYGFYKSKYCVDCKNILSTFNF